MSVTVDIYTAKQDFVLRDKSLCHNTFTNNSLESNVQIHHQPSINEEKMNHSASGFKTPAIAWFLLLCLLILRGAASIFANTFNPIPSIIAEYMGVSLTSINWLFNITTLVHLMTGFFTSWLYKTFGVKWSLVLSGLFLSLGCWIRWVAVKISHPSFAVLVIGQVIGSVSQPILLNMGTTFATLWFTEDKRATVATSTVSAHGILVAVLLLPRIATGADRVEFTVLIVACIASVSTIPLFFLPKKPAKATSYIVPEEELKNTPRPTLLQGCFLLMKDVHFLVLLVVVSISIALNNAWDALMNQAITPYGYSDSQAGVIAAIGIVGQTIGFVVAGRLIDKTKQHVVFLKLMTPLAFSAIVAFIFLTKQDSFAALNYVNFLYQFFLAVVVTICIDMGVEVSHPLPASLSTSIMWQAAQFLSIIFVAVMDRLRDPYGVPKNNMHNALVFQAAVSVVALVFALLFYGPMKRTEAYLLREKNRKEFLADTQSENSTVSTDTNV